MKPHNPKTCPWTWFITWNGCLGYSSSKRIYVIGFPVDQFKRVPSVLCNFIRSLIHGQDGFQPKELAKCIVAGEAMVTAPLHIKGHQIVAFACSKFQSEKFLGIFFFEQPVLFFP